METSVSKPHEHYMNCNDVYDVYTVCVYKCTLNSNNVMLQRLIEMGENNKTLHIISLFDDVSTICDGEAEESRFHSGS